jgi:hypothetical protein
MDKPDHGREGLEVSGGLIGGFFSGFSITAVPSKSVSSSSPGNEKS